MFAKLNFQEWKNVNNIRCMTNIAHERSPSYNIVLCRLGMDGDSDLSMFNKEDGGSRDKVVKGANDNTDSAVKSGAAEENKGASSPVNAQPRLSNGN